MSAIPAPEELAKLTVPLGGRVWRAVENQTYAVTRELVSTRSDQERLEELLEGSKPAYQPGTEGLDYLLKTPFRYQPPKRGGSRFRRPFAGYGVFYGAEHRRTALAELAYHRYRFLAASPGTEFPRTEEKLTVFAADFEADAGLDLTSGPLAAHRALWTAGDDYGPTQRLAERAIEARIRAVRYESVRDPVRDDQGHSVGRNVALLDPASFTSPQHRSAQTWALYIGAREANARRIFGTRGERYDFLHADLMD